ncbi:hypothetical protein JTB14_031971 [Gonioctena quinquepunctata]|nr:hypothetical protein JTB14_031971 [Gonioctena quinquepunctata]
MAIVDDAYKFSIVTIDSNGRVSDRVVFRASSVAHFIKTAATGPEKTAFSERSRRQVRAEVVARWQQEWNAENRNAQWTQLLILDVVTWLGCKYIRINYHSTQLLFGQSYFESYTCRIGKCDNDEWLYCEGYTDDAKHTVFRCGRFGRYRSKTERRLSIVTTPDNFLEVITGGKGNFKVVFETICKMMKEKEKEKEEILAQS